MTSGDASDSGPAGRPAWLTGRAEVLAVSALVLLALALRVVYVLGLRDHPAFGAPTMDPRYHVDWAAHLARGETFQPGPFFRAPLYPWFLAAVFQIFGEDLLVARLLQAGLGACSTLLVYLLGRGLFERRVAWWAAVGAATYWVSIYFDGELLIPTLSIPLNLLALLLSVRHLRDPRPRRALASGVAWGLSAIARPNVLLFLPVLAFAFWRARGVREGSGSRTSLRSPALLTLGVLLPILPLTAYNFVVGEDTALISTQAGVNLWIGNHPGADGSTAIAPGTRATWWGGFQDTHAQAEAAEGRPLRPSEVSRHFTRRAVDFVVGDPGASIPLLLRKLRLFWMEWELANNQEIRFVALRYNPWLRFLPLRFGLVAAAGLLGMVLCARARVRTAPLTSFFVVYTLSVVAFFINGRYRLPVVPVLLLFASYTLMRVVDALRARRFLPAAGLVAVVALGTAASLATPAGLNTDDANGLWQLGVAEERQADLALGEGHDERAAAHLSRAAEHFEAALAVRPRHPFARIALARVLARQGRNEQAIAELERCVPGPWELDAAEPLLDLLIAEGELDRALVQAASLLERHPDLAVAHYARGRVAVERRAWDEALAALREAERHDGRDPRYPFGTSMALFHLEDMDGCLEALRRGMDALDRSNAPHAKLGEQIFEMVLRLAREQGRAGEVREVEARRSRWRARWAGSSQDGPSAGGGAD